MSSEQEYEHLEPNEKCKVDVSALFTHKYCRSLFCSKLPVEEFFMPERGKSDPLAEFIKALPLKYHTFDMNKFQDPRFAAVSDLANLSAADVTHRTPPSIPCAKR